MSRAVPTTRDRRPPQKGDQRRSALLKSLDHHLQESSLDSINIADISRRAGAGRYELQRPRALIVVFVSA